MSYAIGDLVPFPLPVDWSNPVSETLEWLTDVIRGRNGTQQKRQLRQVPRRTFQAPTVAWLDWRRILDAVYFDQGARPWALAVWPDVQRLEVGIDAGAVAIPCRTVGFDFVSGGQALLWSAPNAWEIVTITAVAADHLEVAATSYAWPALTQLYPVRRARLVGSAGLSMKSDEVGAGTVQLQVDEACTWPAAWPSEATYRGAPVLEWRPDESEDMDVSYDRTVLTVDEGVGSVSYFDLPGMPFRTQPHRFVLGSRDEQGRFRSLVYALAGMAGQIWVPSWSADVALAAPTAAGGMALTVEWQGYTVFGRRQANRRDLRVELFDGTVYYRRIVDSSEAGAREVLTLDQAVDRDLAPADVRQIGFMSLCQLTSDTVRIDHYTDADGVAVATLSWQAVKHDL
jgi:hypothetical protein